MGESTSESLSLEPMRGACNWIAGKLICGLWGIWFCKQLHRPKQECEIEDTASDQVEIVEMVRESWSRINRYKKIASSNKRGRRNHGKWKSPQKATLFA